MFLVGFSYCLARVLRGTVMCDVYAYHFLLCMCSIKCTY